IAAGSRGIEPADAARTRKLAGTAATRVLSGRDTPTAQTGAAAAPATGARGPATARTRQLEPRPPAYPPPMSGYRPDEHAPQRSGGSRAARRLFAVRAVVLLHGAAVARAVVIAVS